MNKQQSTLSLVLDLLARFLMPLTLAFVVAAVMGVSCHGNGSADHPRTVTFNYHAASGNGPAR